MPKARDFDWDSEFEIFFNKILKQRKSSLSASDNTILELLNDEITNGNNFLLVSVFFY